MPSSRPNVIPTVLHVVRQLRPSSILDIGVGFGKWGHLFREYTDINEAERDPARYDRTNWRVRIDGVEAHARYLTEMHRFLYNQIHIGNACELIHTLPEYDLIFLGDVIEHIDKGAGTELLEACVRKAAKAVLLSTPAFETNQGELCGNPFEEHRSVWSAADFRKFPGATTRVIDRATLVAAIVKPGITVQLTPPPSPTRAEVNRTRQTLAAIRKAVPAEQPFILVDEEQVRSLLPDRTALPFLERDGNYFGPPPDDATAIRELERLRAYGARAIIFIWSTFWWLDHYKDFATWLRKHGRVAAQNRYLQSFDLG
jgi:hypothetical protein